MSYFVTGAAGFIGSHLADRLLADGHAVVGYDNLSTGRMRFLEDASANPNFRFVQGDLLDKEALTRSMTGANFVFHLAANADVRFGTEHPERDLDQNTIATFNVLEAMRANGCKRIGFSSTGSIYGEPEIFPTPGGRALSAADLALRRVKARRRGHDPGLLRGVRISRLHLPLRLDPRRAIHRTATSSISTRSSATIRRGFMSLATASSASPISTCTTASTRCCSRSACSNNKVHVLNLGTDEASRVNDSIGWISERLGLRPALTYAGGERGWIGDSPFILLDTRRIRALGWKPKLTIREGVLRTVDWLAQNRWVFEQPT